MNPEPEIADLSLISTGDWELVDPRDDPADFNDLSAKHPDKRKGLFKLWDEYVKRNGVIVSGAGPTGNTNLDPGWTDTHENASSQRLLLCGD
jgi:hypothetical protein